MKLIDLLSVYNFRLYRDDLTTNYAKDNSQTIRITYWEEDFKRNWFEFGINDYYPKEEVIKTIKKVLSKEILNREVDNIQVDDLEILEITLK